jgi:uncharacterized membrane protein
MKAAHCVFLFGELMSSDRPSLALRVASIGTIAIVLAVAVGIVAMLLGFFEIVAIMRLTGWVWWVASIASIVVIVIPFAGQIAGLVLGVMGIYYFVTADFNLRDAVVGERA